MRPSVRSRRRVNDERRQAARGARWVSALPHWSADGVSILLDADTVLYHAADNQHFERDPFIDLGGGWYVSQRPESQLLVRPADFILYGGVRLFR